MTVYDRVIPNGAFESLIALSIGVILALGFDFIIKSLRAKFIDTASKRADLEISRRLFEKFESFTMNKNKKLAQWQERFASLKLCVNFSIRLLCLLIFHLCFSYLHNFTYCRLFISGFLTVNPLVIIAGVIQPFLQKLPKVL